MTTDETTHRQMLLTRIGQRHAAVVEYVRRTRPRGKRLTTISVFSSAASAVAMAGPSLGGTEFTTAISDQIGLYDDVLVWQVLCATSLLVSITSTISAGLLKRDDPVARLAASEAVAVELENVRTALEFEQIGVAEALAAYQQSQTKVSFIEDTSPPIPTPRPPTPPTTPPGGARAPSGWEHGGRPGPPRPGPPAPGTWRGARPPSGR